MDSKKERKNKAQTHPFENIRTPHSRNENESEWDDFGEEHGGRPERTGA
jgi:hypothetical protein